jgi:hypothetical protein
MQRGATGSITPSDLYGLTRFLTNTLDNVNAFSDTEILALLNIAYKNLQTYLLANLMHDWQENTLEGSGNGSIALVQSQNNYNFPTDMLTINRVEINYDGSTNGYRKARIIKQEAIDEAIQNTEQNNAIIGTEGNPVVWLKNGVIYVDPIPDQAVSGGLKVYCTTLITDLSAQTDEPVFVEAFHDILAYEAAFTYLSKEDLMNKANSIKAILLEKKNDLLNYYSNREADSNPVIEPEERDMY